MVRGGKNSCPATWAVIVMIVAIRVAVVVRGGGGGSCVGHKYLQILLYCFYIRPNDIDMNHEEAFSRLFNLKDYVFLAALMSLGCATLPVLLSHEFFV